MLPVVKFGAMEMLHRHIEHGTCECHKNPKTFDHGGILLFAIAYYRHLYISNHMHLICILMYIEWLYSF